MPSRPARLTLLSALAPILALGAPGSALVVGSRGGSAAEVDRLELALRSRETSRSRAAPQAPADSAVVPPRLSDRDEARARGLEARLKCPVCRTQSVLESTSFMALEMRAKIRELIGAGRTDGEILGYFADRYGDYILLEPRKRGFGLWAYLLPALAVLAAAGLLTARLRRTSRRSARPGDDGSGRTAPPAPDPSRGTTPAPGLPDGERARVDEELRRYTV